MLLWISRSAAHRATFPFTHFEWPHRPMQVALFRLGLPIGLTFFAETSAFALIALLVARFGSAQVAAHQIALNFASLLFMVPMSLSVAVLTRVGQSLGAGDAHGARYRAWVGLGTAMVFATASALFTGVFGTEIAQFYTVSVFRLGAGSAQRRDTRLQGDPSAHALAPDGLLAGVLAAGLRAGCRAGLGALASGSGDAGHRFLDCAGRRLTHRVFRFAADAQDNCRPALCRY
jgi:hypothetical protein